MKKLMLMLFVLFVQLQSEAQTSFAFADSVIYFQLLSTDTVSKLPVKKVVNMYLANKKLAARKVYIWEKFSGKWVARQRFNVHYYNTEIMVDCFDYEMSRQEIHSRRINFLLDSNQNIYVCNMLEKQRYSEKYILRNKYEFTYRNDTLIRQQIFEQGTTFFKKSETILRFLHNKIEVTASRFEESGKITGTNKQHWLLAARKLMCVYYYNDKNVLTAKDTMHYLQDTLKYVDVYKIREGSNNTPSPDQRVYYTINYGKLAGILTLKFDKNLKPVADSKNTLVMYAPAAEIPDLLKQNYQVSLNDFLQ